MQKEENKAKVGDKEILESEMTDKQKYLANQITNLRKKKEQILFDLDQIEAALTVFQNSFIASTQEEAEEILKEDKDIPEEEK
tara:strand:+ start:213 stop:461 length:249 start_codon:yes stop_codon:yes gene_type:complete